jgi:excisionase family DNA binding protein
METSLARIETYRDASIAGFCHRQGISRSTYYNLVAAGEAPREYRVGKLVRISQEAEHDWVRQREAAHAARVEAA